MNNPVSRWAVAVAATAMAFALATWVSGAFVLPLWVRDDADRWVIATAAGVVLGGLAGLWGKVYATARDAEQTPAASSEVTANGKRSIAVGGNLTGVASAGDGTRLGLRSPEKQGATQSRVSDLPPPTVKAEGERSVAIGGSASGIISTGDEVEREGA